MEKKTKEEIFNTIPFLNRSGDFFYIQRTHVLERMQEYAAQETAGMYAEAEVADLLAKERLRAYNIVMSAKEMYAKKSIEYPTESIQQIVNQYQIGICRNLANTIIQRNAFNADTDISELAINGVAHYLKPQP